MSKLSAMPDWDAVIVGGGAAGLMAGIFAGRAVREAGLAPRIAVVDGAKRVGAKILVSGGGRCNVTHKVVQPADFAGGSANTIKRVLRSFTVDQTVAFFQPLGVELKTEPTGKLFPVTNKARTVLDALLAALREAGVTLIEACRVLDVCVESNGFRIEVDGAESMSAEQVVMATGGLSLPKTGSDGVGLRIAERLGHTLTTTRPALVPLTLPSRHPLTELSGVSTPVTLTVAGSTGKHIAHQSGSMLFTHFGLSGPVVLDISRHWLDARASDPGATLAANFVDGASFESIDSLLQEATTAQPRATAGAVVRRWVSDRLARVIVQHGGGLAASTPMAQVDRTSRRAIAHALTALPLPVTGDRGYTYAEVTAGGVALNEVDPATMASRKRGGLYLCGEMLDVDGRVGGFNFQWAWCTGRLAGLGVARAIGQGER